MSQHGRHVLQGYLVGQRNGGGERVACCVCCQILFNVAQVGDFFQVTVHPLVADDRQARFFFRHTDGLRIFLEWPAEPVTGGYC